MNMTRSDLRSLAESSTRVQRNELEYIYLIMVKSALRGQTFSYISTYVSKETIDELSKEFTVEIEKVGDKIKLNEISWN